MSPAIRAIVLVLLFCGAASQAGLITHYLAYKVGQNDGRNQASKPVIVNNCKDDSLHAVIESLKHKVDSLEFTKGKK